MRIHLIAIGGAVMHNLALALQSNGHSVSGSDDEIYDPAKSRLAEAGLLPMEEGWDKDRITTEIDLIILGMHAKSDNPELQRAQELDLKIVSFPEYIGDQAAEKKRVVIAGSHGKTTTTSMVLHVLKSVGLATDYLVGAQIEGFDRMVSLTDAPRIVIEGDEYLSSCLDRSPKFLHYYPNILVITGVAWDHINVFPTLESYQDQFRMLMDTMGKDGKIFYFQGDQYLNKQCQNYEAEGYTAFETVIEGEQLYIVYEGDSYPVSVFGRHNMENMKAAYLVCQELGVQKHQFFSAMASFRGASKRLELLKETPKGKSYRDYAHAPSKLKASLLAVRERYPNHHVRVIFELHTYSSLNKDFTPQYAGALSPADEAVVFFMNKTLEIKRNESICAKWIQDSFADDTILVATDSDRLRTILDSWEPREKVIYLWMSSGHFGGMDITFWNEKWLS